MYFARRIESIVGASMRNAGTGRKVFPQRSLAITIIKSQRLGKRLKATLTGIDAGKLLKRQKK